MALCLDFYNATHNGFYIDNVYGSIINLIENENGPVCEIQFGDLNFEITFFEEIKVSVHNNTCILWLGRGTNVHRNIAHICFDAPKHVRILTQSVYRKINNV